MNLALQNLVQVLKVVHLNRAQVSNLAQVRNLVLPNLAPQNLALQNPVPVPNLVAQVRNLVLLSLALVQNRAALALNQAVVPNQAAQVLRLE
jgi:hypothetical protein